MHWLAVNWFNVVQTAAVIATLTVAISALRSSGRATKGSNTLAIVASNRQIWSQLTVNPSLRSVMRQTMGADEEVTDDEYRFVVQVIHHTAISFQLAQTGGINPVEGARRDVHDTMNLPVFKAVWDRNKLYQDAAFVEFFDSCLAGIDLDKPLGRRPNLIRRTTKKVWPKFLGNLPGQHAKEGVEHSGEK